MTAQQKQPAYIMPAEWQPHEATWLSWPHKASDWPGKLPVIHWVYGEIVRKLAIGEKVRILVGSETLQRRARSILTAARADMSQVEFFRIPTDRGWTRDSGPIFLYRTSGGTARPAPAGRRPSTAIPHTLSEGSHQHGRLVIADFHFNGWAKYPDWKQDRRVPQRVGRALGVPVIEVEHRGRKVVLEGGGIELNGRGTLLSTEQCYLDQQVQVRNPSFTRDDYHEVFHRYLGASNVLWLGDGIAGDDTHGHIDDVCRFVSPTTVVLCQCRDPHDDHHRALEDNLGRLQDFRLEDGSRLEIVRLPMPEPLYWRQQRLPASYANFYIANAVVLVPTFNDPADRKALGILAELFPDRAVVGIHAVDLVLGLGTLHCLTQQQPMPAPR